MSKELILGAPKSRSKGMQLNELPPAEAARVRSKLTGVYAEIDTGIGTGIGVDLWTATQAELVKIRAAK